jgi:hypothetical protein
MLAALIIVGALAGPQYRELREFPRGQSLGSPVGATQVDPSSILQSVTSSGSHFVIALEDPATVSTLPSSGVRWSVPARDAFGDLGDVDPTADTVLLRLWLGDNGLPPDAIVGAALSTGAMSATTLGIGITLQAGASGATVAGYSIGSGVSWTNTAAAAGSVNTYGAKLDLSKVTSATGQTRYNLHPIGADGEMVLLASGSPAVNGSNTVLGPWDTLTVWAGWRTGAGGTAGAIVVVNADLVVIPAAKIPLAARAAVQDANALPVTGAVPSTVTILGLGNSHLQGAASGPVDTDFSGVPVQAGCTYRQNNGGVVTNVATWGDRQGSVPYLCEELLAAGVTTVRIAVNAGSGRSAQGVIDNIGAAARDVYAMGTPAAPARPDAIVWMGVPIGSLADQAGLDAFNEDFPEALRQMEYHFPGVPIYVHAGIADSDLDAGPMWDEVDAAQQALCAAHPGCVYFGAPLDPSDLDGTDHPTVGHGEGVDIIADNIMAAWGMP